MYVFFLLSTACSVVFMLSVGMMKSFGIIYNELLDYYGGGAGATAFIGSIAAFIQHGGGD